MSAPVRTVGSVEYDARARRWKIQCEPQVTVRLKRVFAKIATGSQGTHELSDTDENARELEWFMQRFPLEVKSGADHLARRAVEHRERSSLIAEIMQGRRELPPFELAVPAREYQKQAAALLLASGGLLLADDVGIGKTATAIATFCEPKTLPALVVTLTHLPTQWAAEIRKFAPNLRTHVLKGTKPYDLARPPCVRHKMVADAASAGGSRCERCGISRDDIYHGRKGVPDVIISNYHKLTGWAESLAGVVRSIVFDEVHELRIPLSNKYTAASHIAAACQYRLGLSATPILNYGSELHSVISILRPDAIGTREEFVREWCTDSYRNGRESVKDPKALGMQLREIGVMLRRTRSEVGRELPPITKAVQHVDYDTTALDEVSKSCAELARFLLRGVETERGDKLRAAGEMDLRLRQATGLAKAPFVAEFVRMLIESGERVVLYGWHRAVYEVWLEKLADCKPVMFTGSESPAAKEESRKAFVEGDSKVLIMSLRAGAGLDGLQHVCRTVVFGELDWSSGVHEQAEGRVARDGQKDPVVAYYLIADGGSDPIVVDVLGVKRQQLEGVRDPNAELVEKLETDPDRIKKLAAAWLEQRGEASAPTEAA